jgi:hypothetical protein
MRAPLLLSCAVLAARLALGAPPAVAQPSLAPPAPPPGGDLPGVVAQAPGLSPTGLTGQAAGDAFGFATAPAGDVNGDGAADVVVGAPHNDAGGGGAGRASLYFGGPVMHNAPDLVLTGAAGGDSFGFAVAGAGDVNGDGYADVLVGAPLNNAAGTDAGRAYVFFGGPAMDPTPDVTLTGTAARDQFGRAVAGAGDVNGDGYDDVVVGAPYFSANDRGRAQVFFGGAAMDAVPDVTLAGGAGLDTFGFAVGGGGDVNDDGSDDVVVGAFGSDAGGTDAGRAYVFFGGGAMNSAADVTLTGEAAGDNLGFAVGGAGDVNADGFADVVAGAPNNDAGGANAGRAYVYLGGAAMDDTRDATLTGQAGTLFGTAVAGVGDVNGDGFDDLAVGAPFYDESGPEAVGRAYVFFGGGAMDADADVAMTGPSGDQTLGFSVAGVDAGGARAVLVGAPNYAGSTGRVYVYRSTSPPIVPRITAVQDIDGDHGGYVTVEWTPSAYDAEDVSRVTHYVVERSRPPGPGGFAWEPVGTVAASYLLRYSAAAPTYGVQTATYPGATFFRVGARTASPEEAWPSGIASGASIDNLAPPAPLNAHLSAGGGAVRLDWDAPAAPDLAGYAVYRAATPGFTPSDSTLAAVVEGEGWTDPAASPEEPWYYRVAARDVNGNEGAPTEELATGAPTAGEGEPGLPTAYALSVAPNPAHGVATLRYALPAASAVRVVAYDALGREVAVLVDGERPAGWHEAMIDGARLSPGVYVVRLEAGGRALPQRVTVTR